jgi:hypothetical protein
MTCKHNWQFTDGGTGSLLCTRCGAVTGPRTCDQLVQDMLQDVTTIGSAWSKGGERIDPLSVYAVPTGKTSGFTLQDSRPTNSLQFFNNVNNGPSVEVLRISKDGIWVNPDVSTDEAAKSVLESLDRHIKGLLGKEAELQAELDATNRQVEILSDALAESRREVTWGVDWGRAGDKACVSIIKRLPNGKIEVVAVEYQP